MIDYFSTITIVLFTITLYLYLNRNSHYWKRKCVPFIPPLPILGNLKKLIFLEKSPGPFMGYLYNAAEAVGQKFVGIFLFNNEPALLVRDPTLIKNIFVKDFQYFADRNVQCDEKNDPVGVNNLFVLRGPKWTFLRSKLSPTFTSGKMKQMFVLVKEIGDNLIECLDNYVKNENNKSSVVLETKSLIARYTTDVISTCAFGIKSNTIGDENSRFRVFGKKIFEMTIKRSLEVRSFFFMHWMMKNFKFVFLQKESTKFFRSIFSEVLNEREKNNIFRNDFLDILIKLKQEQKEKVEKEGTENQIFEFEGDLLLAQPVLFFTAGFETTATTISMTLYEIALQPQIQDRLRKEILNNFESHNGELNYEGVFGMKYLDMVVSETLRKYPPMPFIDRVCTMNYKIPDTDVIIKKGTPVFIALYHGLHYDEKYFPAPEKFDPERFSEQNKKAIPPFTYIPFGEGPHICIGMRFGLMSVKTALALILSRYKVETCEKTNIPMEIDTRSIVLTPKHGNYLRFVQLKSHE